MTPLGTKGFLQVKEQNCCPSQKWEPKMPSQAVFYKENPPGSVLSDDDIDNEFHKVTW